MKTSLLSKFLILSVIAINIVACKDSKPQFTIEGKIGNAETMTLYLERRGINSAETLDSVKLDKDGSFEFTQVAPGYPEFYLLKLNGQTINLAIDSTETISINASKETFATDYNVDGSKSSSDVKEIVLTQNKLSKQLSSLKKQFDNKEINQELYVSESIKAIDEYKEKAKEFIFSDLQALSSYFAAFQKVDDYLIFDPYDKKDLRIFQAIATSWDQHRPESPRAEHIKNFTLNILAQIRQDMNNEDNIKRLESLVSTESGAYYNIDLPNIKNENISLASLQGKVTILDFTIYKSDFSPAHNMLINDVYLKNKDKVEVYQVSFDSDKHTWQNSATNLPWNCVRDENSLGSDLIIKYNITNFPSTFLLNRKGEIVKRLSANDDLSKEVQKLF